MFDIGWTEMLVIAVVMIVVVGPKDLPRMLRTFGKTTAKLRVMAGDFQKQFNEALKEADLDDVKKSVNELRSLNPTAEIKKQLNPFEKAAADVRAGLETATQPKVPVAADPLKNGATAMPGVAGPEAMPAAPTFPAAAEPTPAIADVPTNVAAVDTKAQASASKPKAAPAPKSAAKPAAAAKPKKAAARKAAGTPK
ncbi:Sec-independent protein translocase protein TatB [Pseudaminobacter sp. NGMCC 1.201702]|jgi:sec-independent protein translocase protein TatB|uniref:Sec-independent protein translocase protein TatB n=1 Tax=Pseudaminobacter sp. NGMCC 1.201702 TaxID=3391825 RepID=UPI0039F0F2B9